MPDPSAVEAQLAGLPDKHARILRARVGLDDGQQKTPTQAAAVLGMNVDDYRKAERDAFQALRGSSI